MLLVCRRGAPHGAFCCLRRFRQIHLTRPIGLSLINSVVTVYLGAGSILLGWLAGRSLSFMFALIGVVILVGAVAIRVDDRHTAAGACH
jgi:hypothetical protein